jgi:hypothetical protein
VKGLKLVILSVFLISGCGGDSEEESECPEVTLPVIIPAVNVQLFDTNQMTLNVCDAILTIDSANGNETIYGSARNDCSNTFSLRGGYNLIEHTLLVEKAGFISQRFEAVVPVATQCGYDTLDLRVILVEN